MKDVTNEDILTFTKPETRWLSNMAYVLINHDGLIYPSVENYYQAMKYKKDSLYTCSDTGVITTIHQHIAQLKPHESKQFSKLFKMTVDNWEEIKVDIMSFGQIEKYSNPKFRKLLLDTGNVHLEEGNWWNDKFWGVDIKTREGKNTLGIIIMALRDQIRGVNDC